MKKIIAIFLALVCVAASAQTFQVQTLQVLDSTNATSSTTGGATFAGGAGFVGDVYTGSAFHGNGVLGNLNVSGSVGGSGITNLLAPYDLIGAAGNKAIYVSASGNDGNSGLSWGLAKQTIAAGVAAASGGGTVFVGQGNYNLTAQVNVPANVKISCIGTATITQANNQNLTVAMAFGNNSGIFNCTIDGNRIGNTDNANAILLYVGSSNDVSIINNAIQNGSGDGIVVGTGLRPIIANNRMTNFYVGPIYIVTNAAQTATFGQITGNILYGSQGQHAITASNSDWNTIANNSINTLLQTGTVVSTSGTTVTWVSGPTFANLQPGMFAILNGGSEFLITSITSTTSLQVNMSPGTLSNVPAAFGSGDLISILAASHNTIANNTILGGVGGGIVLSNFVAGESAQKNLVIGNTLQGQGEGCIEIESENAFSTQVFDNQIRGNSIANCGVGTTAVAANTRYGIALIDFNPNTLLNTFIEGNYVRDDQGSPTTLNWLETTGLGVGQVIVQNNGSNGVVNPGVAGGILSVNLSAGWGSTASATATSYGNAFVVNVTSSGTGQSSSPTVTVNTVATSGNPPVMACQFLNGTGVVNFAYGQTPGVNAAESVVLFAFNGTPAAGNTYNFLCRG